MNIQEFTNLYIKQDIDEKVTSFNGEIGFSLVRQYPEGTPYQKDGKKMFIKVAIINNSLFYSVDMTKPEKRGEDFSYILTDGREYKKSITNFISNTEDNEFIFDQSLQKVIHLKSKKKFNLNQFIDVLVFNHLSDCLFWKRKLNYLASGILKIFFWLVKYHYDHLETSMNLYHFKKGEKSFPVKEKEPDPFFKYFDISKNILFLLFITLSSLSFFFGHLWSSGDFSVSNPTVVLFFFLILFSCEKISLSLEKSIREFLKPEDNIFSKKKMNFIEKLHQYQQKNQFNLKIK